MNMISLDLSTTCTGWAVWDLETKKLISHGTVKPGKVMKQLTYPMLQAAKAETIVNQLLEIIQQFGCKVLVIEEVNRGVSRLGQKTLDGFHFIFAYILYTKRIDLKSSIFYLDSDGKIGWRSKAGLNLNLSPTDKLQNDANRKLNKKLAKGSKVDLITKKTLAIRYVNKHYGLNLKESTTGDSDIADAIGLGHFYLNWIAK